QVFFAISEDFGTKPFCRAPGASPPIARYFLQDDQDFPEHARSKSRSPRPFRGAPTDEPAGRAATDRPNVTYTRVDDQQIRPSDRQRVDHGSRDTSSGI